MFFFFQAEDGIRDIGVTGVQTCALPILLERAGIQRADLVIAVTGDDEDNILICQMAKEKYLCERTISRVNNPRNLQHFELLGIQPAVSATDLILRLIEHEVPQYGLVHLRSEEHT